MLDAPTPPNLDELNPAAMKALVAGLYAQIEHLKLVIAKLRRMQFGRKSEKVSRHIEQLDLQLEGLADAVAEPARAVQEPAAEEASPATTGKRRSLPEHLRREVHTHLPEEKSCPSCGGTMRKFGEAVSEMLEYIPASFLVIRHVRPKLSCAC